MNSLALYSNNCGKQVFALLRAVTAREDRPSNRKRLNHESARLPAIAVERRRLSQHNFSNRQAIVS
jgi:hypothetical protein